MVKKCIINNKKYLCKKTTDDIKKAINYKGSGIIIKRLKNKYGRDCIVHESILCVMPVEQKKEFKDFCLKTSLKFNVVESDEWLNLEHEMGGGGSTIFTNHSKGRKAIFKGNDQKWVKLEDLESYLTDGWVLGITQKTREKLSRALKGMPAHNKGKKMKKDHEYKTKPWVKKTEEEKFINRSNGRKKLYSDPEYLAKFKAPRKPLIKIINSIGEEFLKSRAEIIKMGLTLRSLLKGGESKGWKIAR
jgi:hypothetical protein